MRTLIRKLQRGIHSRLYVDANAHHEASVLVAGTGRSGTTWVSDIVNFHNDHRVLFEPFYPQKVELVRHFRYRQYLRPDNDDPAYVAPARAILTGRVRNRWIDRENRKLWAQKRLIKDIRANLLLRWMHARFPGMRTILIFRHPCAVANSKLKLRWSTHLSEFLEQPELMEDFLSPVRAEMAAARTDFEKHIFLWCVENYVPLKQFRPGELHLAFYEPFCQDPRAETERLFSFLGRNVDEQIQCHLRTPSTMVRAGSAILSGGSLTESWRKDISNDQIKRCTEILHLFGLDRIYTEDSLPDIEEAYAIMSPR